MYVIDLDVLAPTQVLDDTELRDLQPVIMVSDSEAESLSESVFPPLPVLHQVIDLDSSQTLVTDDMRHCAGTVLHEEPSDEEDALSPIQGDESPHHRLAKLAAGFADPPGRPALTQVLDRASLSSCPLTASGSSRDNVSLGSSVFPSELTRGSSNWCSGVASWSQQDPIDDSDFQDDAPQPVPRRDEKPPHLRVSLNKATRWGRCPNNQCLHSLKPWIFKSGPRKGHLVLMCSRWWSRSAANQRACWGSRVFPQERFKDLHKSMQTDYNSLQNMLLRNGARGWNLV